MEPLFLAAHPLIDFLNTTLAPGGETVELIDSGGTYVEWLVAAELLETSLATTLIRRFSGKALDAAAAEARRIREWSRAWLTRWRANPRGDYRKEMAGLNELLARGTYYRTVVRTEGAFRLIDVPRIESADALAALIAAQLAALITHEQPELIKSCASAQCTLWFLDRTKSHRRMFCSATACGNRARVAAFRDRQRSG